MSSSTLSPRLCANQTVAVVAPAGPVPHDRLRAGLDVVASRYRLRVADDILRVEGYLAGSDARRADELMAAIADPDVRAVFVARGGYGLMRILPQLDPEPLRRDPKPIVGFSDATALLSWAEHAGVAPIHGPVVAQLGELPAADHAALFALLEQPTPPPPFAGLRPLGRVGGAVVEGALRGGNLSLVASLVGTPWAIPHAGSILLMEDVGERPYAVDRYLTRLALAGLAGLRGVAVGDFTRCVEKVMPGSPTVEQVIEERVAAFGLPGLAGLGLGHGASNRAVPYGAPVQLDLDAGELIFLGGAVA